VNENKETVPQDPLYNFVVASVAGGKGIEESERNGQSILTRKKDRLPIKGTVGSALYQRTAPDEMRRRWEAVGFTFGEVIQERNGTIFVEAAFPPGWTLKPTEHAMWNDVVDEKGRKRAAVFFKAAFYDYSAHTFGLETRYNVKGVYGRESNIEAYTVADWDGTALHTVPVPPGLGYSAQDEYRKPAQQWLDEHYPDNADPLKYW
jgi:hypothetical protein